MSMKIDKENDVVAYNDAEHKYIEKSTGMVCVSATSLIHKFTQPFDATFWSCAKALEALVTPEQFASVKEELYRKKKFDDKYVTKFGIQPEEFIQKKYEILDAWKTKNEVACERGTAIHKMHEDRHMSGNTKELQHLGLGGTFKLYTTNKIIPRESGIYPELLMHRISEDGKLRIAGQADLVIIDGTDVHLLDYKGLCIETPIFTTKGFKLLKDITKSDIIFDKDGNETKILNISDVHYNPCYKIKFDNGEEIIADHEHRWLISFHRSKGKFKDRVLNTVELKEALEVYKEKNNNYFLPKIINAKPLNTEYNEDLPIDPYILGYWLGDGTSAAGSVTAMNQDFWKEVIKRGYTYGEHIGGKDKCEMRTIFGLSTELRNLNLLNNKHIPDLYLLASYEQRLDLLRGFMDADGYYNPTRKRFVMATTREKQADYLIGLLSTLGVKPTKIYAKKYCNKKEFDGWDVTFTMKDNPFLIRNQDKIEYPKTDKASFRVIKSVELIETIPTKCLEVDSPSHTFLAGYGLLPTHNTNAEIKKSSYYNPTTRQRQMMQYPLNNIQDCNYMHYQLQLSLYMWMILKAHPELTPKSLTIIHYDHKDKMTLYDIPYLEKDVERMLAYYKGKMIKEEMYEKLKPIEY